MGKIDITAIDAALSEKVPLALARKFDALPLLAADGDIVIALPAGCDEADILPRASRGVGARCVRYTLEDFSASEIRDAIDRFYGMHRLLFGELLVRAGLITPEQRDEALAQQAQGAPERMIGEYLADAGVIDHLTVQKAYARQIGCRFIQIENVHYLDLDLIQRFPRGIIEKHRVLPLPEDESGERIYLLTAEEVEAPLLTHIGETIGAASIEPVLTTRESLEKLIADAFERISSMVAGDKMLGQILIERGLLSEDQLEKALEEQEGSGRKLGEILIQKNVLPESAVLGVIAEKLGIEYLPSLPSDIDPAFRQRMTRKFALFNKIIPIGGDRATLHVAMTDPADKNLISVLTRAYSKEIKPFLAGEAEIVKAINRLFVSSADVTRGPRDLKKAIELDAAEMWSGNDSIVNRVNSMLHEAVSRGVSDIHINPEEDYVRLLYRIDGSLRQVDTFTLEDRDNIVTRIKILGDMRIDARHVTQSGRIVARFQGRRIDFRVSILPSQFGENVVLRILDSAKLLGSSFDRLGMPQAAEEQFLEECRRAQGIILVTGPTGSGKTTTLYHVLNHLRQSYPNKSISTIENPIEYVVGGIVQSEVNDARGLGYASILKEKLRQDPDIIMVGEIRNLEEGSLAFTAALTGHLVLTTLHTNDGATTIRRLVEMGLEPFNVSSGINCILSQRLARRICDHCRTDYAPLPAEVKAIRRTYPDFDPTAHRFKRGWGCQMCHNGYRGRIGIYELLLIDAELKRLVSLNATDIEIRDAAVRKGMKTLRMAGLDLAFQGVTTIEEVLGVTDIIS